MNINNLKKTRIDKILKRPLIGLETLRKCSPTLENKLHSFDAETIEQTEILVKYESYIEKEKSLAIKLRKLVFSQNSKVG